MSRVPASFAGKQGKCPGCQKVIEVPDPASAGPAPLDAVDAPARGEPPGTPLVTPAVDLAADRPAQDLVFDVSPTRGNRGRPERPAAAWTEEAIHGAALRAATGPLDRPLDPGGGERAQVAPSPLDYVLCVVCSSLGCVVGLVLLLQGYHRRGGIMILVSIAASIASTVLLTMLQALARGL